MENTENFFENLEKIINEGDEMELSNFTYDLLDCLYVDIVAEKTKGISKNLIEGYISEIRNSLEIINPVLTKDIDILNKALVELELYFDYA